MTNDSNFEFFSSSECNVLLTVHSMEAIAIVTLNALTIIVYLKERTFRKGSMYLVISLTVADMFVACSLIFRILDLGNRCNFWSIWSIYAYVIIPLFNYFPTVSVTNLAAISLERVHATFRPFKHRLIKKKMFGAAVAVVWFTAGLFAVIILSPFQLYVRNLAYFSFHLCCLLVILASNTSIAAKFYWGTRPRHHGVISRERKLTKTLFIATVVSLILLMPCTITMFLHAVSSGETFKTVSHHTFLQLNYSVFLLFCCNSFINPLLYTLKMPEFKRTLLLLLRCPSRSGQTSRS